jgi:biotin synthase
MSVRKVFADALERAANGRELSREDLQVLLGADEQESTSLFELADEVRSRFVGEEVHLRGLIEFSNYCTGNCLYCGLRKNNRSLVRYRMSPEEIMESARRAADLGCRTIVLQSGEDRYYTAEDLAELISRMKGELDVAITISIGDRTRTEYELLKEAGADRYLLKFETSDPRLFSALRPGTTLEERLKRIAWLKELGYQVGSGNIVGLPGQSLEILVGDILLLRRLGVEMAGIGPFIPADGTPLERFPPGDLEQVLMTLALVRLVLPRAHLPATTATATLDSQGRLRALKCGANVIMPNMTPQSYRENYRIYPGKLGIGEMPEESYAKAVKMVESAGRRVSRDYGHGYRVREALKTGSGIS